MPDILAERSADCGGAFFDEGTLGDYEVISVDPAGGDPEFEVFVVYDARSPFRSRMEAPRADAGGGGRGFRTRAWRKLSRRGWCPRGPRRS